MTSRYVCHAVNSCVCVCCECVIRKKVKLFKLSLELFILSAFVTYTMTHTVCLCVFHTPNGQQNLDTSSIVTSVPLKVDLPVSNSLRTSSPSNPIRCSAFLSIPTNKGSPFARATKSFSGTNLRWPSFMAGDGPLPLPPPSEDSKWGYNDRMARDRAIEKIKYTKLLVNSALSQESQSNI